MKRISLPKQILREERDKAIKEKYEKLNNDNISKFSADRQAKIGCKSKSKKSPFGSYKEKQYEKQKQGSRSLV
jgi:hypothetical protein